MTPSQLQLQLHSYPAEVMIAGRAVWVLAFARISAVRAMLVAARRQLAEIAVAVRMFRDWGVAVCYNQLLSPMSVVVDTKKQEQHKQMSGIYELYNYIILCMDIWIYGYMDGWLDGWMAGWMDGWLDGWMDGWIDR